MKRQVITLILLLVLCTVALSAAIAEGVWTCEFCNKTNLSNYCTSCGRSREEATNKEAAACARGEHDYAPATCTAPKTCVHCGATEGMSLGHDYTPATYTAPEICTRCGATRGEKLAMPKCGDSYIFGSYEQDDDPTNGKEPIEWIVLENQDDRDCLLLSKYALDWQQYNTTTTNGNTWDNCSSRAWLNNDFLETAFNAEEKERLVLSSVPPDKTWGRNAGEETEDYVFILSEKNSRSISL